MRAVRYDRFGGIDELYLDDLPEPEAQPGELVVRVMAAALNPGALPALNGSSYVPGRDFAGSVVTTGSDVDGIATDDAVLGRLQSWDAHAELIAVPAADVVKKPDPLSWDVAGSLFTTPMAGLAAVRAVQPVPGERVVISGASGGVGLTAAQLCVRAGATVVGLTSPRHFDLLRSIGVEPVQYGDGEEQRIRGATADRPVSAFIDTVGGHYIALAIRLGVDPQRIDTVVDFQGAKEHGAQSRGTSDAGGADGLSELARLAATGELAIPIAQAFPLSAVKDAYRALADRTMHGRIVLHPQQL